MLIALVAFIFFWVSVRPALIRSSCYKKVYASRENEDNFKWAEGKVWTLPAGENWRSPYQWVYEDQGGYQSGVDSKNLREKEQKKNYEGCLLKNGIKN